MEFEINSDHCNKYLLILFNYLFEVVFVDIYIIGKSSLRVRQKHLHVRMAKANQTAALRYVCGVILVYKYWQFSQKITHTKTLWCYSSDPQLAMCTDDDLYLFSI